MLPLDIKKKSIITHLENYKNFIDGCSDCMMCILCGACGTYLNKSNFNSEEEQRAAQIYVIKQLANIYLTSEELFDALL